MWTVKITTVNVNGIRAAHRKGMPAWLASEQPDVLLLQEVRATDEIVAEVRKVADEILSNSVIEDVVAISVDGDPVDGGPADTEAR